MLSSVEQAFVGRDEKRAPIKTPAWEASYNPALSLGFIGGKKERINIVSAQ